jgi:hypothetical protein
MHTTRESGRSIGAVILIGLGVVFLLSQWLGINIWDVGFPWPFWIILPGAAFLLVAFLSDARKAPLAVPGMVITGTGMILLYQSMTDRYETWSYLWGLYPVFVGIALVFMGSRTGNHDQADAGRKTITIGLILTAVFGVFMESIFSGGLDRIFNVAGFLLPLFLIGGGLFLLLRRPSQTRKAKHDTYAPSPNGKPKRVPSPAAVNGDLQQRIDEALAEDE